MKGDERVQTVEERADLALLVYPRHGIEISIEVKSSNFKSLSVLGIALCKPVEYMFQQHSAQSENGRAKNRA